LNESSKWNPDAIERSLAHADTIRGAPPITGGPIGRKRVEMAQWWSDHLDVLRDGGTVISLKTGLRA
jgi:hypothetical protein